ncbi:MAG: glycosyltransferase family 2 protein, partial [Coprobacillus cateniformis]
DEELMNNIDLSIIVPVYNVENYLRRGLDSILLQPSSITYEILLIDDGSSDKSGTICDEYQKKFPNVFVSHIENNGVAEARNLGISLSRGNYLYFMDPDDFCQIISLKRYLLI